jgi:hypothetical protein
MSHVHCSTLRSMPGAIMFPHLNTVFGQPTLDEYRRARAIVDAAGTAGQALEQFGALDGLSDVEAAEVHAVLEVLPRAVDRAIIAALQSGFARDVAIHLEWVERSDGPIEVRVFEEPHGDEVRVRIAVVTPHGATFLS